MEVSKNKESVQNSFKNFLKREYTTIEGKKKYYFFDFRKNEMTDYVVIASNKQQAISMLQDEGVNPYIYNIVNDGLALRRSGEYFSVRVCKI